MPMDYKPSNSSAEQEDTSTVPPITNDSKERVKVAYIAIGAISILVVAGIATWYFLSIQPKDSTQQPAAVVKTVLPALTDGNANADITNDINKIPSDSSAFAKDQSSINNSINGL